MIKIKRLKEIVTLTLASLLIVGCIIVSFQNNVISFLFSIFIPILFAINVLLLIYCVIKRKLSLIIIVIIGFTMYFGLFNSFFQINFKESPTNTNVMSVLSFNVHNFYPDSDIDGVDEPIVNSIKERKADVICFQEFSAIKYKKFKEYPYWFKTNIIAPNNSVMAIFSKYPIVNKNYIDFPNSPNGAMFIDILYKKQVVRIYNIHLQSFEFAISSYRTIVKKISKTIKLQKEQAQLILEHIKSFNGKVIITGDFNSTQFSLPYYILRENRKDSYIEKGKGFGTTYELLNYPLRLDYILLDNSFEVVSHQNFNLKLSDHEPVFVKLRVIND